MNSHNADDAKHSFFRILPVRIYGKDKFLYTFAFLDEGSSVTLMDQQIFDQLKLKGERSPLCLHWTGDQTRTEDRSIETSVRVSKQTGGNTFNLRGVRTVKNLGLPAQSIDVVQLIKQYPHLKNLPIASYKNITPTILIGADNWNLAVPLKVKEGKWHDPIATKTRLSWTIQGCTNAKRHQLNVHMCVCKDELQELHDLVKSHFKLESPANNTLMSSDDTHAISILHNTCKKIGNRYDTGLLFRNEVCSLPDSYSMALKRLSCLMNKMRKDVELKKQIQKQFDNLITKNYAEKLSIAEIRAHRGPIWYLPTFVVLNPNKPGKVRLVWDAAAKTDGKSLNDFMLSGSNLLNSLFDVLLGFRIGRVGICGDIAEMFHQIRVRASDAHVQRFLWWNPEVEAEPSIYVMRALSFGLNCAPCIAQYIRNKNADLFKQKYPRAVQAIQQYHYMEDLLDSADDEKQILEIAQQVHLIHKSAGFKIRNWISNSKYVMETLENDNKSQIPVQIGDSEKVLGVFWDPHKDNFKYVFKFARVKRKLLTNDLIPTKRELLQIILSIFDPFGFLSCHVIALKILLQEIWRAGLDWDEELPEHMLIKWRQWKTTIPKILAIEIPRCLSTQLYQCNDVQMHVFVDAGEQAYAAVAYLRVANESRVTVSMIAAKAKVAPLKPVSIPRMELQAALMGVQLATQIQKSTRLNIKSKIFWTDSVTVLKWLSMDPRTFKQFVMFRVAEILENTVPNNWKWVPSKQNPADLAAKICPNIDDLFWLNGPSFLLEEPNSWPHRPDVNSTKPLEIKENFTAIHINHSKPYVINIEKFSRWRRLYRVLATVLLFMAKLRAKARSDEIPQNLNVELLTKAKHLLFKQAQ